MQAHDSGSRSSATSKRGLQLRDTSCSNVPGVLLRRRRDVHLVIDTSSMTKPRSRLPSYARFRAEGIRGAQALGSVQHGGGTQPSCVKCRSLPKKLCHVMLHLTLYTTPRPCICRLVSGGTRSSFLKTEVLRLAASLVAYSVLWQHHTSCHFHHRIGSHQSSLWEIVKAVRERKCFSKPGCVSTFCIHLHLCRLH